jgi:hypothetical protein
MIPGSQCRLYNRGFKERRYKFFREAVRNDTTTAYNSHLVEEQVPNYTTCKFELWEPLPIEPFSFFPKFQPGKELSIVKKLNIRIQFENNLIDFICCGRYDEAQINDANLRPKMQMSAAPKMCVRYIPKVIPPERIQSLNVHYADSQIFKLDRTSDSRLLTGTQRFTFDIAPDTDKVYFYMQKRDQGFEIPTETFLGIEEIQIKTPNADHVLDARQLFDNWNMVSHNHDLEFDEFRYTKSVACISVRELRLDQRLHMIVKWRNAWKVPSMYDKDGTAIDDGEVYYNGVLIMDKKVQIHT